MKERAEHRAGAGHNSAVLVCCEGTYPLRTPESQAEDLAATVVAKAAAVLHCRMLARP